MEGEIDVNALSDVEKAEEVKSEDASPISSSKQASPLASGTSRSSDSEPEPEPGSESESESENPLPELNASNLLPKPYLGAATGTMLRNPDHERIAQQTTEVSLAKTLPKPPKLSEKTGLPMTRAERKALRDSTTGPKWFDLPAPSESDLPRLAREVEMMRLRNALDPKRYYKADDNHENPLPKHFVIGHIVATDSNMKKDLAGAGRDDLPKSRRKRTIVEELLADEETKAYAKKRFEKLEAQKPIARRQTKRKRN
ncbi:Fcf2 pre-rRNA processing-domain-containing protein [Cantharellus anzutake]|uniref:Fcf2 pre-rRNA processing-domain-containing protein n=1 Tax=Cantharellus anzutake TaxID=1750568 RepID=UPI001906969C|nr:Fcf2 pre-rRNA processing-domain-containing protein [Cantharellus anzutake]KAF8340334.1 Fcf2 pre-rRNA processing-domain-containing protein [Cantharellus anzutake]